MNKTPGGILPLCCHQTAFLDRPPPSHTTDVFLAFLSWTPAPPGDKGSAMLSVRSRQLINHSDTAIPVQPRTRPHMHGDCMLKIFFTLSPIKIFRESQKHSLYSICPARGFPSRPSQENKD